MPVKRRLRQRSGMPGFQRGRRRQGRRESVGRNGDLPRLARQRQQDNEGEASGEYPQMTYSRPHYFQGSSIPAISIPQS
jgi:hypothetical protein